MTTNAKQTEVFYRLVNDINQSDLTQRQKNAFKILLFDAPPQALDLLTDLFDQDPMWVSTLYKNYLSKRELLHQDNHHAWEKLIQGEYKYLKKFEA
jgi:hypothetical protein